MPRQGFDNDRRGRPIADRKGVRIVRDGSGVFGDGPFHRNLPLPPAITCGVFACRIVRPPSRRDLGKKEKKEKMPQTNPFSASLTPLTRIPPPKMASFSARRRRARELPDTLSYFYLRLILCNNVADREQLLRRTHGPAGRGSPDATGSSYTYPDSLAFPARPAAFRAARHLESPIRTSDNRRAYACEYRTWRTADVTRTRTGFQGLSGSRKRS